MPDPFNAHALEGRDEAERYLAELEALYARMLARCAREAASEFRGAVTASGWQPPPEGNVLSPQTLGRIVAAASMGRVYRRILRAATGAPLSRLGISWTVKHPLTEALLAAAGQRTGEALGEAVQPILRATIAQAYEEGLSVKDAADRIRDALTEATPAQAHMLARTDLNGLANGGSVTAAKLAGVGYKQWLTAEDDRVRPEHEEADGQTVPVDQPFTVCGETLDFPGDPAGSNECTCNCRCSVVYLDAAEAVTAAVDYVEKAERQAAAALQSGGTMGAKPLASGTEFLRGSGLFSGLGRAAREVFEGDGSLGIYVTAAVAPPVVRWTSDIAFEGTATGDGRYFLANCWTWREPPLTLMAMVETADGHDGALVAGRIDRIRRDRRANMDGAPLENGTAAIRASGVFDVEGDFGAEVARMVDDETLRGVSVDYAVQEWAFRDPETGALIRPDDATPDEMERAMMGELQFAAIKAEIMAATVCPTPAFANARVAVAASGERVLRVTVPFRIEVEAVTAGAAGLAPMKPPKEWFETPEADGPRPLTVSNDGRVTGHIAVWDSCHTGKQGVCFQPPNSPSGYAYFNLGEVLCADGSRVACGQITLDTDHAPLSATGRGAKAHYEHTGAVGADVRATDGRFGIWVAGAVRPGVTEEQARALMAAKPSGDWRSMTPGGPLELIGILAVNVPGFPVPRPEVRLVASAEQPGGETVALVAAGLDVSADGFDRRLRVLAARAEGGIDGLAELAGV